MVPYRANTGIGVVNQPVRGQTDGYLWIACRQSPTATGGQDRIANKAWDHSSCCAGDRARRALLRRIVAFMGLSIAGIVCTVTLKLLACPEKDPPPPPPIQALPPNSDPAEVLAFAQQPVATGTRPRNLILFIADGMGVTAVAAARALIPQKSPATAPRPASDGEGPGEADPAAPDDATGPMAAGTTIDAVWESAQSSDTPSREPATIVEPLVANQDSTSDMPGSEAAAESDTADAEPGPSAPAPAPVNPVPSGNQSPQVATADVDVKPAAAQSRLSFELFPASAISRTSLTNLAARDFAGAVSALLTGKVPNPPSIGMDAGAEPGKCPPPVKLPPAAEPEKTRGGGTATDNAPPEAAISAHSPQRREYEVPTLLEQAKDAGYAVGFITTSRVTLAAPAATYAHTVDRNWEIDTRMPRSALDAGCSDIARQLVEFNHPPRPDARFGELVAKFSRKASKQTGVAFDIGGLVTRYGGLDVIMGGGRIAFLPQGVPDPVDPTRHGVRSPVGQGGVNLIAQWLERNPAGVFVTGATALQQNARTVGPILGLFAPDHMALETDRRQGGLDQPSLAAMARAAIARLARSRADASQGYVLVVDAGGIDRAAITNQPERAVEEILALSDAVATAVALTSDSNDTLIVVAASHGQTMLPQGPGVALEGFDGEDVPVYARGPGAQWIHGVIDAAALHDVLAAAILPGPDSKDKGAK